MTAFHKLLLASIVHTMFFALLQCGEKEKQQKKD